MTVHKQSVSLTDAAFAFARELVEAGEYPNVSAAVTGETVRAKATRERERALLEAEVQRRLALPPDQWEPVAALGTFTANAREHLTRLKSAQESSATS
jgi:Arc/MetJ-type ribon-helix-helix transcriptional regulator